MTSPQVLAEPATPAEQEAVASSRAHQLFVSAFEYPDEALRDVIASGKLAEILKDVLSAVDPDLASGVDWSALAEAGGEDDLAVEYTRLFDVGAAGPPCPLYGGLYGGARMKAMEEALRFYNHFGLNLSESPRELPDHLSIELEFLHFLAFREAEALQQGEDPGPFRRARRDFATRHPGKWIPKLRERLEKQDPMSYFRELVGLLDAFLSRETSIAVPEAAPDATPDAGSEA